MKRLVNPTSYTRRSKSGFTLVELLVVIGIIALLISMLLPALNRARESAKSVQCQSNLRQIMVGTIMYANNHNGVFPAAYWSTSENRIRMTRPHSLLTTGQLTEAVIRDPKVWDCPADVTRGPQYVGPGSGNPIPGGYASTSYRGNWFTSEGREAEYNISYGYNRTAGYNDNETSGQVLYIPYRPARRGGRTSTDPIWFDFECGIDSAKWGFEYGTVQMEYLTGGYSQAEFSGRHGGAVNVAAADGHVESFMLPRMYFRDSINKQKMTHSEWRPWMIDVSRDRDYKAKQTIRYK